jgi:hypothetical protein
MGFHGLRRISPVLGLSLAHCYRPRSPHFTTVSFPTKLGNNHLATTVHEPTLPQTHTLGFIQPAFQPPHPLTSNWLALFSRTHYSQLPPYVGHIPVLYNNQSKVRTSHAVRELVSATITWHTEPCYNIHIYSVSGSLHH